MGREPSCRALGRSRVHRAVAAAKAAGAEVLWIPGDPIFHTRKNMVPDLASHAGLSVDLLTRELVQAGEPSVGWYYAQTDAKL